MAVRDFVQKERNAVRIIPMEAAHYEEVHRLWEHIDGFGLRSIDDSREGITRFLRRNPGLSVVAVAEEETPSPSGAGRRERIVGSVLCGEDGRRGCLYHVCVEKRYRREGIGAGMVERCMHSLREIGINKVSLIAFTCNDIGNTFWKSERWTKREDLNYYDFTLNEENITSFVMEQN